MQKQGHIVCGPNKSPLYLPLFRESDHFHIRITTTAVGYLSYHVVKFSSQH